MDRSYSLFQEGNLSTERLRTFLMVADKGSIARAAGDSPGRQNLFSRHIGDLGKVFGAKLLERKGKGIVLSAAGRQLVTLTREYLQGLEDFRSEGTEHRRTFTIGAGASLLEWLVAPQMDTMLRLFPRATIRLESARTADLVARLRDGELDFAIVRDTALQNKKNAMCESLGSARYVLVVPKKLGAFKRLPANPKILDIARLPLVLQAAGGNFHRIIIDAFAAENCALRPLVEAQSFLQVRAVIESGACAGILPTFFAARLDKARFASFPLSFLASHVRPLVLHWIPRRTTARGVQLREIKALAASLRARAQEAFQ